MVTKREQTRQEKKRKKIFMMMNSQNLSRNGLPSTQNLSSLEQSEMLSQENLQNSEQQEQEQDQQSQQPHQKRQYRKKTSPSLNQNQATGSITNFGATDEQQQPVIKLSRQGEWIKQNLTTQMIGAGMLLMKASYDTGSEALQADAKTMVTYGTPDQFPLAWAALCDANKDIAKWTKKALEATPYTLAFGMLAKISQELASHHGINFTFRPPFITRG